MESLPFELVELVVDYVAHWDDFASRADLKNLRLTNGRLAKVATPHLFHTVSLWVNKGSICNLLAVSEHSQISRYVTGILFSPLMFAPSSLPSLNGDGVTKTSETFNVSDVQYERYKTAAALYQNDHRELFAIEQGKSTQDLLVRTLRGLPNLTRLEIESDRQTIGSKTIHRDFGSTLAVNDFTKAQTLPAILLFRALADTEIRLTTFCQGSREVEPSRQKELKGRFQYLEPPGLALRIHDRIVHPELLGNVVELYGPPGSERTRLLSNLSEITMRDIRIVIFGPEHNKKIANSINWLGRYSRRLKEVEIGKIKYEDSEMPYYESTNPFARVWSTYCEIHGVLLCSLETLETVTLNDFLMPAEPSDPNDDAAWSMTARDLRKHHWPRLKTFTLRRSQDRSIIRMEKYLKEGSVDDPLPIWEDYSETV